MSDIFEAFIEIVLEILIRGPGYLIVRSLRAGKEIDHDDAAVFFVGLIFWCAVFGGLWAWFG